MRGRGRGRGGVPLVRHRAMTLSLGLHLGCLVAGNLHTLLGETSHDISALGLPLPA